MGLDEDDLERLLQGVQKRLACVVPLVAEMKFDSAHLGMQAETRIEVTSQLPS